MTEQRATTLQIGDLALQIEGPRAWISRLERTWTGWTGGPVTQPWRLVVRVGQPAPDAAPLLRAQPRCEGRTCRLSVPGFAGTMHPDLGIASLEAHPNATVQDLSAFLRTTFALQAFEQGGVLFHAAGIEHRGHGYALFGRSGSGKTTAALASAGDAVLNDDLILVKPGLSGWELWATPFGERWSNHLRPVPLCALLRLVQAGEDRLTPMSAGLAMGELVASSPVVNGLVLWLPALLSRWELVLAEVPVRGLHFRKGAAFWEVIDAEFE